MDGVLIGIFVAVVSGLVLLYIKRSRLKVSIKPNKRWLFEDIYSPDINARITNVGYDKTEVCDARLELKKGHAELVISDVMQYKTIDPLESKTTINYLINCSEIINRYPFKEYQLIRVKILTTNDKVYNSNWLMIEDVINTWK